MDKVYFKVDGQSLIKTGGLSTYASHTVKYIEAEFALTDEWLSYDSIRAIWQNGDTDIPTAVTHGKTMIPAGVLTKKGRLIVNLVASTVDGDEIDRRLTTYPTTAFMITVEVKIDGADPEIITPSQYEQFVHAVKEDADRSEVGANRSETEADRAESEADQATASAQASESSALRASGYADDAKGHAQDAAGSATASARSATASANSAAESANSASASATSARQAEDAKETILRMRAVARSLSEGSQATASYENGVLTLGIPKGDKGDTGNGIDHVVLNEDYTLTIFFTDGTSTITTSIRGEKGETGAVPDFTIGEVVTLDPDEEASAEITGTAENPILNLGIPQGKTGEVSYEDLSSLLPLDTATGDIISIPDGQPIIPAQSLKVQLSPKQSGSGTPSPDNVRPIEGWTDVDTHVAGKNLFDKAKYVNLIIDYDYIDSDYRCKPIQLKPNQTYTVSIKASSASSTLILINKYPHVNEVGFTDLRKASSSGTYTTDSTGCLYIGAIGSTENVNKRLDECDIQIELGSAVTEYAPYQDKTIHTEIEGSYTPVATDDTPYIMRDTPDVDGDRLREKIVGGSVGWNQNISDGLASGSGTASANYATIATLTLTSDMFPVGHKILAKGKIKSANGTDVWLAYSPSNLSQGGNVNTNRTSLTDVAFIYSVDSNYTGRRLRIVGMSGDTATWEDVMLTDLTQMFGSTIADYIYSLEQSEAGAGVAFFKSLFPSDYYPYNSGELMSVKTSAHVMTDADGNAVTYPLDDIELRGIPKLADGSLYYDGDVYESDGTATRNIKGYTFSGAEQWIQYSNTNKWFTLALADAKFPTAMGIMSGFSAVEPHEGNYNASDGDIWFQSDTTYKRFYICTSAATNATDMQNLTRGKTVYYNVATPTSESATPFEEIQKVFAGGTEEYIDDREVPIPVGHETEYLSRETYGCTIDIVTGELTTNWKSITINGDARIARDTYIEQDKTRCYFALPYNFNPNNRMVLLDKFEPFYLDGAYLLHIKIPNSLTGIVYGTDTRSTAIEKVNAWLANNPIQCVWDSSDVTTIQLTPEEIKLLLGDDTIWSDGPVTMIYNADVTRWIEKKLS